MNNIYIGIDGGASKCKVKIEDTNGNLLGTATGGPVVFKHSVTNAWDTILQTINTALQPTAITLTDTTRQFHLGMGLTGCEITAAKQEFLRQTPPHFAKVCLHSDAYTACIGAHASTDGAIIIIGTGVVSIQIHANSTTQIGGWGFPHSDEGGGAWLGLEAIRSTFQWLDNRRDATPLLHAVFAKFANDLTNMVTWANRANSSEFATIAPLVVQYLEQQDPMALELIQQAAKHIDQIGLTLAQTSAKKTLPCALMGGLAPFITPWLGIQLRARLVEPKCDAATGAIMLLKKQ